MVQSVVNKELFILLNNENEIPLSSQRANHTMHQVLCRYYFRVALIRTFTEDGGFAIVKRFKEGFHLKERYKSGFYLPTFPHLGKFWNIQITEFPENLKPVFLEALFSKIKQKTRIMGYILHEFFDNWWKAWFF